MEHPYHTRTPHLLTDHLRQQWLRIRTQNRHLKQASHRPDPAHIEPNVPSTRNKLEWDELVRALL
jgi:putative SOS response-associated peptidase YedK